MTTSNPPQAPKNAALLHLVPLALPVAAAWVEDMEKLVLARGEPLNELDRTVALQVGVRDVDRVRILIVEAIPTPDLPGLEQAVRMVELFGPNTDGLTVGSGILIRNGRVSGELIAHELRHVHQYEQAGSITAFLERYLWEIGHYGYEDAPYEVDARKHESHGAPVKAR